MKLGKMMSVPVLLVTFLLLAGPVRAHDEAKKTPSEPSKTADSTSSAQSNPSCTPQSDSVSVLTVSLFDGSCARSARRFTPEPGAWPSSPMTENLCPRVGTDKEYDHAPDAFRAWCV